MLRTVTCRSKASCCNPGGRALHSRCRPWQEDSSIKCSFSRPIGRAEASSSVPASSAPLPSHANERPWKRRRSSRKLAGMTLAIARASLQLNEFKSRPSRVRCFGVALTSSVRTASSASKHPPRKLAWKESNPFGSAADSALARTDTAWVRSSRLSPVTLGSRGGAILTDTSFKAVSWPRICASVAKTASPAAPEARPGRLILTRRWGEILLSCPGAVSGDRVTAPMRRRPSRSCAPALVCLQQGAAEAAS
mmetsp:Transcript_16466/g.31065  ORF Transcript_16466/g.31065 Transcript_16466/m.31065 type:complete len:251 (-) Transcript_16466:169-921(-)